MIFPSFARSIGSLYISKSVMVFVCGDRRGPGLLMRDTVEIPCTVVVRILACACIFFLPVAGGFFVQKVCDI